MKKSLMILVVGAFLGTMLIGCSPAAEGNNDAGTATNKEGTPPAAAGMATPDAPAANTPAAGAPTDANMPAAGNNEPATK